MLKGSSIHIQANFTSVKGCSPLATVMPGDYARRYNSDIKKHSGYNIAVFYKVRNCNRLIFYYSD